LGIIVLRGKTSMSAAVIATISLSGCTTVNMMPSGNGQPIAAQKLTLIGLTKLRFPEIIGNTKAVDVRTLGAGWQSGPFFGWNASNLITANPADCQLIIIVRSSVEAQSAAKIVTALEGKNPCIIDYSKR
jgi:hypothetical protein